VLLGRSGHDGHSAEAPPPAPPPIGTPKDLLVSLPLNRQPVAGWQLSGADIGLHASVKVGALFASNGTKAYFITNEGCEHKCLNPTGWLYGLDTTLNPVLFSAFAVSIADTKSPTTPSFIRKPCAAATWVLMFSTSC
jgi:hypothetical protein